MKIKLIYFVLLFAISSTVVAQTRQAALDKYFTGMVQNQQFTGNVLIAENGKIVYEKSFGYADFDNKIPNTTNIVFPIASISKTITATAILQLAQSGKLNVLDPVAKYLHEFPYPTITIRHLLSHTSGLPPYNAFFDSLKNLQPERVFTNADFMKGVLSNKKPLIYEPGEKGNYDNINFIVLALVLEEVSKMSFNDYVNTHILKPAHMNNTKIFSLRTQYTKRNIDGFAFAHLYPHLYSDRLVRANTVPYIVSYWSAYDFSGFGDYVSTTHDLLKYDEAYYNGSLLSKTIMDEAFTPVKLNNEKNNRANFGLGWEIEEDTSFGKVVYHSGAATGLSCVLLRNISKRQTIILFDNAHYNAHETATGALKILNGVNIRIPGKSIAKVYAAVLLSAGAVKARDTLNMLKADTLNYYLSEDEMNSLGYDFMGGENNPNPFHFPEEHKYKEAFETLKTNSELFPNSWNAYDSFGEILVTLGRKDEAIKMYQKSIELNPKNENGKKMLERLSR